MSIWHSLWDWGKRKKKDKILPSAHTCTVEKQTKKAIVAHSHTDKHMHKKMTCTSCPWRDAAGRPDRGRSSLWGNKSNFIDVTLNDWVTQSALQQVKVTKKKLKDQILLSYTCTHIQLHVWTRTHEGLVGVSRVPTFGECHRHRDQPRHGQTGGSTAEQGALQPPEPLRWTAIHEQLQICKLEAERPKKVE